MRIITKHHEIVRGYSKKTGAYLISVSSLCKLNVYGVECIEGVTIFDDKLRILEVELSSIQKNFGEITKEEFKIKYPEYLL